MDCAEQSVKTVRFYYRNIPGVSMIFHAQTSSTVLVTEDLLVHTEEYYGVGSVSEVDLTVPAP